MSLYKNFKTDTTMEKEGILLDYGQNDDGTSIRIRIARAGGANQRYLKRMDYLSRPYRHQLQRETLDAKTMENIVRQAYAETIVLGWENVQDEDGADIEFSVENALKLFKDLPELFDDIQKASQKIALFKVHAMEEDAGN